MNFKIILAEATKTGWHTIVTPADSGKSYVDFLWMTNGGQPFSFSAEWDNDNPDGLIEDIEDFETSFNLSRYLDESLEGIRNLTPSKYFEIYRELEDIHTRVWLLWVNLKYLLEKEEWLRFPPYSLN